MRRIVSANSCAQDRLRILRQARACRKIRSLSCAQLFAETILRINRADSVSSLFVD